VIGSDQHSRRIGAVNPPPALEISKEEISLPKADNRPEPAWTKRWQCYDRPGEKVRKQGGLASREAILGPDRGLTTRASRSQAGKDHGKRRRRFWQGLAPEA
jgi:hypothetical protein